MRRRRRRRLPRLLLNAATAVSLVLCVVCAGAWPTSVSHPLSWSRYVQVGRYGLSTKGGIVSLQWHHGRNREDWPVDAYSPAVIAGIGFERGVGLYVPYGHVIILLLILPAARLFVRIVAPGATPRLGLCPACGYDLRGTPDRCPECGVVPSAPPPSA